MKIKKIDGRIERKQKSLSTVVGYVAISITLVMTKVFIATKRLLVVMNLKMEKMHGLGYVAKKQSSSRRSE